MTKELTAEDDWVALQNKPLDVSEAHRFVTLESTGGQSLFVGTVRRFSNPGNAGYRREEHLGLEAFDLQQPRDETLETIALEYEAYPALALKAMKELIREVRQQDPLERIAILHRLGRVEIGQPAIVIAASSQHRRAAIRAVEWLIDQAKQRIPIWKRECLANGQAYWVHPKPVDR